MKKILLGSFIGSLMPVAALAFGVQVMIDGRAVELVDVPQSSWFATYVRDAAEAGVVSGYRDESGIPNGHFGPSNSITIAEALKIAVEGAHYDVPLYASKVSSGVDHWSSAYVSVAKAEGFPVIPGTLRRLDRAATRAEVAALFTAAFHVDLNEVMTSPRYTDVSAQTEFESSIEALSRDGVVSGDTNVDGSATGTFRPTENVNRAEVVKMIMGARGEYGLMGEGRAPSEEDGSNQAEENVVLYTDAGFTPSVLRIKKGESVTFKNQTTTGLRVASDPHPAHDLLAGFDSLDVLAQGQVYVYTFNQIGTWGYHNHIKPTVNGSIIVEE